MMPEVRDEDELVPTPLRNVAPTSPMKASKIEWEI